MRAFRLIGLLSMLACLIAAVLPAAAQDLIYGIDILSVHHTCTDVFVVFRFNNIDYEGPAGNINVALTVSEQDETEVASQVNSYFLDFETQYMIEVTFPPLVAGDNYFLVLDASEGQAVDEFKFVANSCGDGETSSAGSVYVEPPPCKLNDGRLDETCGSAPIVTYSESIADSCYVSIYSKYGRADGKVVLLLQATAAEIAAVRGTGGNAVIESVDVVNLGSVTLYWLSATNEFQINAGPNEEGKVYVLNFTGCPATNVYTSNSYQEAE